MNQSVNSAPVPIRNMCPSQNNTCIFDVLALQLSEIPTLGAQYPINWAMGEVPY